MILNTSTGINPGGNSGYTPSRIIKLGNDTLWGSWHFIPENAVISSPSPIMGSYHESITGLLFDKNTQYVSISTQTNYLVPVGKKLYLFLPSWGSWQCSPLSYPGYFRINGNNYIASPTGFIQLENQYSLDTEASKLLILPQGTTIEYVDNPDYNSFCVQGYLPPRVFTGYLK